MSGATYPSSILLLEDEEDTDLIFRNNRNVIQVFGVRVSPDLVHLDWRTPVGPTYQARTLSGISTDCPRCPRPDTTESSGL